MGTSRAEVSNLKFIPLTVGNLWRSWRGENRDLIYMLQGRLWRTHHGEVKKEAREAGC